MTKTSVLWPRRFYRQATMALAVVVLATVLTFLTSGLAGAVACGTDPNGKPVELSIGVDCGSSGNPLIGYTQGILKVIIPLVGVLVVGIIVAGGIMIATANGNSGRVQSGINVIRNAIIALLIFIFMAAILKFLLPGL